MNYYNRYPGDYAKVTQDLSLMEHGAYTLLLDHLYGTQRVLPKNPVGLFRVTRAFTQDEQAAVMAVIDRFFVETDDGYTNKRFEEERIRAQARIDAARRNGAKGGRKQKPTQDEPEKNPAGSDSQTQAEPSGPANHQPSAISHVPEDQKEQRKAPARKKAQAIEKPDDVTEQTWSDWLQLRKLKRAAVTDTVINHAKAEAEKAGMPLERFLQVWCARGSQGLEASWLKPSERAAPPRTVHDISTMDYSKGVSDDGSF